MKSTILHSILLLATAGFASADDVSLAKVPAAVQETINAHLKGGHVDDIEIRNSADGTRYHVEIDRRGDDDDIDLHLREDGSIIRIREDISVRELPAAAREVLLAYGGEIDDLKRETAEGKVTYRADIDRDDDHDDDDARRDDDDLKVVVTAEGKVLSESRDD